MSFHVGQKVVCVDASANTFSGIKPRLVEGAIYTVGALEDRWDGLAIDLIEVPVNAEELAMHSAYNSNRFRPLIERKTDTGMAVLKKLLKTKPHDELVGD